MRLEGAEDSSALAFEDNQKSDSVREVEVIAVLENLRLTKDFILNFEACLQREIRQELARGSRQCSMMYRHGRPTSPRLSTSYSFLSSLTLSKGPWHSNMLFWLLDSI